jgi:hypothetical protein
MMVLCFFLLSCVSPGYTDKIEMLFQLYYDW